MIERIGFIGTGTITEAIICGLAEASHELQEVWVSPRNKETSAKLVERYNMVRVGRNNQEVVDQCKLLCLAVRPQVAQEVLEEIRITPDHHILSFIATWNHDRLVASIPRAGKITRLAPLPMVAQRNGATILYPRDEVAVELFDKLGLAIAVDDEPSFDCLFSATALMGSFFAMLEQHAKWLQQQGIPYVDARNYLASLFSGLASTAAQRDETFEELSRDFSTAGGLNEQVTAELAAQGVFHAQTRALGHILDRIRSRRDQR